MKIFEDDCNGIKDASVKKERPQALPCFKPRDLYSYHSRQILAPLAFRFAADELAKARTALAGRIAAEFKNAERLCPAPLVEELKALRRLANRVVMGVGKYLSHEDLITAFTLRSKRLVTQENLSGYMVDCQPDGKPEWLLFVEENIIGIENKRQLANFVFPVMTPPPPRIFPESQSRPIAQLIVDRGPAHVSKKTKAFVKTLGSKLELFYLPPYSPDRNPGELVWKHLKADTAGRMVVTDKGECESNVVSSMRSLQKRPEKIRAFYQKLSLRYAA